MLNPKRKLFYFFIAILIITIIFFLFLIFNNQKNNKATLNTSKELVNKKPLTNNQDQTVKVEEVINENKTPTLTQKITTEVKSVVEVVKEKIIPEPEDPNKVPSKINLEVPFTSQAPFAEWDDPRQQDGCEEASLVMAWYWINDKSLSKTEAKKEILALHDKVVSLFGDFGDTSAEDTVKLFKEYYNYSTIKVVYDIDVQKIKDELVAGKLVLLPTDGTILQNPNYTPPGPTRHMIVVTGYDDKNKQFITNDPGTRRGEDFRFSYQTVIDSNINYSTGTHAPLIDDRKVMIVVSK